MNWCRLQRVIKDYINQHTPRSMKDVKKIVYFTIRKTFMRYCDLNQDILF